MRRKTASQVLREASPDLTIIPGGAHRHGHRKKAVKLSDNPKPGLPYYVPHRSNDDDWNDVGGEVCPRCHQKVTQLVPIGLSGKRKLCKECLERKRHLIEHKRRLLDIRHRAAVARVKELRLIS